MSVKYPKMQKGDRFYRLVYLGEREKRAPSNRFFGHFQCDCGKTCWQNQSIVSSGKNKSCGCFSAERSRTQLKIHGASGTPEWNSWNSMRARCRYAGVNSYEYYGGKGIKVCARWVDDFQAFLADVGPKPFPEAVIDRIDSDKDYEPGNVRWSSVRANSQNLASVIRLTHDGVTRTIPEWAELSPVSADTIRRRIKQGMSVSDAIFSPNQRWAA